MGESIFSHIIINEPEKAFENAIKKGLKNPQDWMYMNSTRYRDYFKHIDTRAYISYWNWSNVLGRSKRIN